MDAPNQTSELSRRALAFYRETLRAQLEPAHNGRGIAIHPDSGDYKIADTPTQASRAMHRRHPEGGTVSLRIGLMTDYALAGRLLAGEMQEAARIHEV